MPHFIVSAAISGTAWCEVEATNLEEAVQKAKTSGDWEIDDWDINEEAYRGGFISAEEN